MYRCFTPGTLNNQGYLIEEELGPCTRISLYPVLSLLWSMPYMSRARRDLNPTKVIINITCSKTVLILMGRWVEEVCGFFFLARIDSLRPFFSDNNQETDLGWKRWNIFNQSQPFNDGLILTNESSYMQIRTSYSLIFNPILRVLRQV